MQVDSSIFSALLCFEAAGRFLSFTKAAAALNVTQSAVSQHIRQLEARLGYMLLLRQSRGLKMTENGEKLHITTSRAIADINLTLRELATPNAPLQVSCLPSFALQWLMPRLTAFHQLAPGIPVRIAAEFHSLAGTAMEDSNIHIAVRYDPVQYSHLYAEPILNEYLVPVATPEYLASHPAFVEGKSIKGIVLLHDAEPWVGAAKFIEWRTWLEVAHPEWAQQVEGPQFNLSSLALSAALNHQGVAMGRIALVHDDLMRGRLTKVFNRLVQAPARYVLICREPNDHRVAAFSRWLKAECSRFNEESGTKLSRVAP